MSERLRIVEGFCFSPCVLEASMNRDSDGDMVELFIDSIENDVEADDGLSIILTKTQTMQLIEFLQEHLSELRDSYGNERAS